MQKIYSLDEITLIPKAITYVKSRTEVNPFDENGKLPLFVSPMTCVLNLENYDLFNTKTYAVLPVFADNSYLLKALELSNGWFSVSLNTFRDLVNTTRKEDHTPYHICIDMANGHMEEIFDLVPKFKNIFDKSEVMVGNIANADTYNICCDSQIDYVRVGIGGGSGCITSAITGFHNGMVNLLQDIKVLKNARKSLYSEKAFYTKVVADGGINTIARAIKCLALGADYIMAGKLFTMCHESAAEKCYISKHYNAFDEPWYDELNVTDEEYRKLLAEDNSYKKYTKAAKYYGQASEEGQIDRFGKIKSAPEGVALYVPVKYTYDYLMKKFESALRCAMSYNGSITLDNFHEYTDFKIQSINEFNAYNK